MSRSIVACPVAVWLIADSIIAVQGLGANPSWTWQSRSPSQSSSTKDPFRTMWLKDLLPTYFPSARIAIYAYPSEWLKFGKGTKTTLRDCGEQLLNVIKLEREAKGVGQPTG